MGESASPHRSPRSVGMDPPEKAGQRDTPSVAEAPEQAFDERPERRRISLWQRVQEVGQAYAVVLAVQPAEAGIVQSIEQQRPRVTSAEGHRLARRTGTVLRFAPEAGPGSRERLTHNDRHHVTFANGLEQPARVRGAHAHRGAQLRLHLARGVTLDLEPGEEAPLGLSDVAAARASRIGQQPLELGEDARRVPLAAARRAGGCRAAPRGRASRHLPVVRADHLLLGIPGTRHGCRRSHQRQETRSTASFIATGQDSGPVSEALKRQGISARR